MSYAYLFKYILIGDASVGKSCFMLRFTENRFPPEYDCTIGVDFGKRTVTVEDKPIQLNIWDTAGAESFRSITQSYYRDVAGALLVFDVTRRETYNNLSRWLEDARRLASRNITIMLIANKCDLAQKRVVSKEEGEQFAKANGLLYMEISSKTARNVDETFMRTTEKILRDISEGVIDMSSAAPAGIKVNDVVFAQRNRCCG